MWESVSIGSKPTSISLVAWLVVPLSIGNNNLRLTGEAWVVSVYERVAFQLSAWVKW